MEQKIEAHKITKPIQLLAAWLIGLVVVNGSFLGAASAIESPTWVPTLLVIASVVNVPLFLVAIFLLQTKFRPEMQEDTYYSKYLESKTKEIRVSVSPEQELSHTRLEYKKNTEKLNQFISDIERRFSETSDALVAMSLDNQLGQHLAEKVTILEKNIEESKQVLRQEKSLVQWAGIIVRVNNQLTNYASIIRALEEERIPFRRSDEFGANIPDKFQISFSSGIEIEVIRKLINALGNNRLDYLDYSSEKPDSRRVIIGSYAFEEGNLGAELTEELLAKIKDASTTTGELQRLVDGGR
jgi:hypothetical protein